MIAVALWFLASLDAAFTGYRDAAGRNALIDKTRYYRRAMIRGLLFGQIAVGLAAAAIAISLALSADYRSLLADYNRAGARMLAFYIPYAVTILIAFLLRAIPSVDIRSITSTLIFGPFTLIRPLVAIIGLLYGVLGALRAETVIMGLIVLTMMLGLERALGLFRTAPAAATTA
jgi:hypothetical protein